MIISPQWSLVLGIIGSFFIGRFPKIEINAKKWSTRLLQLSVILLGTSLHFNQVINDVMSGAFVTAFSLLLIFGIGHFGIKYLSIDKKLGTLITMGTAICGGSAIAALAPVIGAEAVIVTISIAIVFLLNSISILIFPILGHYLEMSQAAFGTWAALAIHDTSSVIGASSIYGEEALGIATTIKLTRALWIIPVTIIYSLKKSKSAKLFKFPWFVLGFLIMSLTFTFIDKLQDYKDSFLLISKNGFSITLFLIGLTFNPKRMKEIGMKPFLYSLILWVITTILSFLYATNFL
jgi:uncharacterized integral membrane protein (TIGR00698 family)